MTEPQTAAGRALLDRFYEKVALPSPDHADDACWLWMGGTDRQGYGQMYVAGQSRLAHRVGYELLVGPIPLGLTLDHLCRNRNCVSPKHLQPITNRENIIRGISPSAVHASRTHCPKGHAYTTENTRLRPNGQRECVECHRARNASLRACPVCGKRVTQPSIGRHMRLHPADAVDPCADRIKEAAAAAEPRYESMAAANNVLSAAYAVIQAQRDAARAEATQQAHNALAWKEQADKARDERDAAQADAARLREALSALADRWTAAAESQTIAGARSVMVQSAASVLRLAANDLRTALAANPDTEKWLRLRDEQSFKRGWHAGHGTLLTEQVPALTAAHWDADYPATHPNLLDLDSPDAEQRLIDLLRTTRHYPSDWDRAIAILAALRAQPADNQPAGDE